MSIFSGLLAKAENLVAGIVTPQSKTYFPHKSKITVSGVALDGWEEFQISTNTYTRADAGINTSRYAYYDYNEPMTLTVSVLPTARCWNMINRLSFDQTRRRGWVNIGIYDNGQLMGSYRGHLLNISDITINSDAPTRMFTFGLKDMEVTFITNELSKDSSN